jgi:hypothetical protein
MDYRLMNEGAFSGNAAELAPLFVTRRLAGPN